MIMSNIFYLQDSKAWLLYLIWIFQIMYFYFFFKPMKVGNIIIFIWV